MHFLDKRRQKLGNNLLTLARIFSSNSLLADQMAEERRSNTATKRLHQLRSQWKLELKDGWDGKHDRLDHRGPIRLLHRSPITQSKFSRGLPQLHVTAALPEKLFLLVLLQQIFRWTPPRFELIRTESILSPLTLLGKPDERRPTEKVMTSALPARRPNNKSCFCGNWATCVRFGSPE